MEDEKTTQQGEKQLSHISYKEYQKKVTKSPSEGIAIFVSAFFILLLLFLGIAKQISPEVDVSIGDNENLISESIGMEKAEIDERLKLLQMEDEGKNDMFVSELEEKVVIPREQKQENDLKSQIKEELPEKVVDLKPEKEASPKPEETASPAPKITVPPAPNTNSKVPEPVTNLTSKVVVGYYSTKEQAEVAKEIIAEEKRIPIPRNGQIDFHQTDSIEQEKFMGDIVPDLYASCENRPYIVEILVTHEVDEEKLQKIMQHKISAVEINLSDKNLALGI